MEDGDVNKEEILIALKEIHARYCIPSSEQNYTDKDYACMQYEKLVIHLQKEIERLNNIIKEVREYITSYESIETIQQFDHNKNNKDLDYSTIDEMTRRYMMVHDKILKILDKEVISNE